jgi:hypothetical protein
MKKSAVLICGLLAGVSSEAANITWVSLHPADNQPSANAAGQGFTTMAPDIGYTDLLRNAGHTVTRFLTLDNLQSNPAAIATLNASDLVIISRSVPSGHYQADGGETAAWNGLTAPVMVLGGYIIRGQGNPVNTSNTRLGLMQGFDIPDTTASTVSLTASDPNHPIFSGLTLGPGNTIDYANRITYNDPTRGPLLQRGISVVTGLPSNGSILATVGNAGDPAVGGMLIGEWSAGAAMNDIGANDTLGGHRMVFLTGSREHAANSSAVPPLTTSGDIAGIYDLTPTGAELFLNAVDYMAVPEPSTYALFALGAGAMGLLARRKKN